MVGRLLPAAFVALLIPLELPALGKGGIVTLKNVRRSNEKVKALRSRVREGIVTIKSRRNPEDLPVLTFYKYNVARTDNFWKLLARTSLDIDTLMTVNGLSSPRDIHQKKVIFFPNLRGIIFNNKKLLTIEQLAKKFQVGMSYIKKINGIEKTRQYLFIPCGKVTNLERSLFLGTGFASPIFTGRKSSGFGRRIDPINKKVAFHSGMDIACRVGTPVKAARRGQVVFTGTRGGYGKLIILKHTHDYYSYYGHLSRIKVKEGSVIERGSQIGLSGNTGRTTGPHLHFEVRKRSKPVNPGFFLKYRSRR